ncbi:low affinity immunoglobulin gamma Fc region receptor III-A-like [Aquarana catesbeiana]|uniref:low affinity immunoglobulin gamma Fc region receptor III-A-like n=1 Tax=Aquarana catesbeiana TaxID=8400 RepID=UPI003CCA047D
MTVQSTALIVFISTILGHTGSAVSPVVTFTPNWKKIFIGESITMKCDVGSSGGRDLNYVWYKDYKRVNEGKIYTIRSANTSSSGDYSCQAGTERSDTTRLDIVEGNVPFVERHGKGEVEGIVIEFLQESQKVVWSVIPYNQHVVNVARPQDYIVHACGFRLL